jgi:hypothetical protein
MAKAIEVLKDDNHQGTLEGALAIAFPGADVQKLDTAPLGSGMGTVSVNGVDWDWLRKADRFRFIIAE